MPELPEVETVVRRLRPLVVGKQILEVEKRHPKPWHGTVDVVGAVITGVKRRAKVIIIELDSGFSILVHLKMTGQLIYADAVTRAGGGHPTADWIHELPGKHTRVWLKLSDEASLFFNDQRLFGWMRVMANDDIAAEFVGIAPDVIDDVVDAEYLYSRLQKTGVPIKMALLNPEIVAGLGNIYVCDALHLAKINPRLPASDLSLSEVERTLAASKEVLNKGIKLGGTTFDGKYVDVSGFAGGYQNEVRVYGQNGLPCIVCGTPIDKFQLAGRGTYWCPVCQK